MHCSDKNGILKSTVEYIKCLKREVEKLQDEAKQFRDLEKINRDLGNRIKELEMMPNLLNCDFDLANICLDGIFDDCLQTEDPSHVNSNPSSFMSQQEGSTGENYTFPEFMQSPSFIQSNPTNLSVRHPSFAILNSATNVFDPELFIDQSSDSRNIE
ncbi:uncharacterized protein LOC132257936 [Phlebotomus argentipes]|uniref:uncharacterized protein LOC132257936 n=1 Tax=Phlebotomus argentipes TaxID=94469 RepID=UPI002892FBC4|nr:uncharacterized protein LOC132257936 [Phlebotomus argentipes]